MHNIEELRDKSSLSLQDGAVQSLDRKKEFNFIITLKRNHIPEFGLDDFFHVPTDQKAFLSKFQIATSGQYQPLKEEEKR